MQIDIAQHIEKLLYEHETVIVPSFGGFTATRSPASLDAVGGTIAPPSKTIAFNENLTVDDGILIHELSHLHSIGEDDARRLVQEFVSNTRQALDQREIVSLPGIGRLYKNYAQKVQFLPDTTNFNTDSYGLPKIQFKSVSKAKAMATPPATVPEEDVDVATIDATEIIETIEAQPEPMQTQVAKDASTVATEGVDFLNTTEVTQPPVPVETPMETEVNREVRRRLISPLAAAVGGILLAAIGLATYFFLKNSGSNSQTELTAAPPPMVPGVGEAVGMGMAESKNVTNTAIEEDDESGDISEEADEYEAKRMEAESQMSGDAPKAKPQQPAKGQSRCVLIVGTFQDRSNVTKLLAKLEGAGFDTYHRKVNGHQVGIEFYYNNGNMKEIQDNIVALQKLTGVEDIWIKKR